MGSKLQKRVFIIHGWGGYPEEGWFPWMKKELEKNGFKVHIPSMPDTDHPKIETWIPYLAKQVGKANEHTYLVGHSIGCQAILRYVEKLEFNKKIGGMIFVAGWLVLSEKETEEEATIAKPWIETPIDFKKIKQHSQHIFTIFSDNDEVIPAENKELLEEHLGGKTVVEHAMGHFSGGDGIKTLPSVLRSILSISTSS